MKIVVRILLVACVLAPGWWIWQFFFPSPEKVIRHRLEKLASAASFSAGDNQILSLAAAQSVQDYFAPHVEVTLDLPGRVHQTFAEREDIREAALQSRRAVSSLSVKFPDINVAVGSDGTSATADLTLQADVGGQRDSIIEELQLSLIKTNDDWLITRVKSVRVLSPN